MPEFVADGDASYPEGLRLAVSEALSYGINCVEKGEEWSVSVPPGVIGQARRAARDGVGLDIVLRRYAAGNKVLEEFIVMEARDVSRQSLCRILSEQGPLFDRLMASVAAEYGHALEEVNRSSAQRRASEILQLLFDDHGSDDNLELDYDFDAWHIGVILSGNNAEVAARLLSERLGCRLLHVLRETDLVWGWLGSPRQPDMAALVRALPERLPAGISLAAGEPRKDLEGWRLTHHEAQMAYRVGQRRDGRFVRGRDVALLASAVEDRTLVRILLDTYLAPITRRGSSGLKLSETLRVYFCTGESTSAAAESLGITRQTVRQRIRVIENALGQPFHTCNSELRLALQVQEFLDESSTT